MLRFEVALKEGCDVRLALTSWAKGCFDVMHDLPPAPAVTLSRKRSAADEAAFLFSKMRAYSSADLGPADMMCDAVKSVVDASAALAPETPDQPLLTPSPAARRNRR